MIIHLTTLEKQSRPNNIRGFLRIQRFCNDVSLCPMAALIEYFNRVSVCWPNLNIFYNLNFYRFLCLRLIDQHFLFHSENLTVSSLPRPWLVGFVLYWPHLEWIQVSSSLMLPDQQQVCCSAKPWIVSSYARWPTGVQPVAHMKNFTNDTCEGLFYIFLAFMFGHVPSNK